MGSTCRVLKKALIGIFLHISSVKHRFIQGTGKRRLFHECFIPYSQEFIAVNVLRVVRINRLQARIAMESVAYTGIINELIILCESTGQRISVRGFTTKVQGDFSYRWTELSLHMASG